MLRPVRAGRTFPAPRSGHRVPGAGGGNGARRGRRDVSTSTRRERQLARDRATRRGTRRAERERRRRRRNAVVAALTAAVVLLGVVGFTVLTLFGGSADTLEPSGDAAAPEGGSPTAAPAGGAGDASALPDADRPVACGATAPPPPRPASYEAEPPLALEPGADYVMTLRTSCGEIVVDLAEDEAPRTVNSFRFLAGQDFFDGAPFSRLTGPQNGFVVLQGGDQEGTGSGSPGYTLPDEALEGAAYTRGTIAMANAGPGTGGSQFFLLGADTTALGPQYTPFGRVESGLDVLDRILALGHDGTNRAGGGRPNEHVYIEDLTLTTR